MNCQFKDKYINLLELMERMTNYEPNSRPDCQKILSEKILWSLSINDLENNVEFVKMCNKSHNIEKFEENFHSVFIKRKFDIWKQSKH